MPRKKVQSEPREAPAQLTEQVSQLRALLCQLDSQRFEELLRTALEEILDRRVYCFKSGYQFGADMGTDPLDPQTVRLEAKRYQKKLDQRSLLGEIDQVADHDAELDLWIVGTTAAVGMMDVHAIRRAGIKHGIGVEVIDLAESKKAKLPQVLWLALPTTATFIEEALGVEDARQLQFLVQSLAERHGYDDSLKEDLIHDVSLFDTIAEFMRRDLRRRLGDPLLSWRRFNQVIHDASKRVPRSDLTDSIVQWFSQGDTRADLCLVEGADGRGKSWIAFEAVDQLAEAHLLIPIVLTAKDAVGVTSLEEAMALRIAKVLPQLKASAWERKIQRWFGNSLRFRILLFFDGLNEEPEAPWSELLDEASIADVPVSLRPRHSEIPPLRPLATVATCRSQFWQTHFSSRPRVRSIQVGAFSREELEACLKRSDRKPDEFQKEVLELMRIPKITGAVVKHYDALRASGEITVDRLLYEEWKLHREQKRGFSFAEGEFRALLKDLAQDYFVSGKKKHRSHEIRSTIGPQDAEKILVELSTSGVLEPAGDGQHRLESSRLYHALGLLLYDELSEQPEAEVSVHRERIGGRLDSVPGLDEHAPILAAAIFAAVNDSERPRTVLFALLQAFGHLRNVSRQVRDRVDGYLPAIGRDLVELAEYSALNDRGSREPFKLIERILIRWSREDEADDLIRRACKRWISFLRWQSSSRVEPSRARERRNRRLEMLLGEPPAADTFENHGSIFTVVEEGGNPAQLRSLAITLVSARGGRIESEFFRDWALVEVAEIFFHSTDNDPIPWLLRFLPTAQNEALVETVEGMLTVEKSLWQEAAYWLSQLISHPRARELKGRSSFRPDWHGQEAGSTDPCESTDWRSVPRCFEDGDIPLRTKAQRLNALALDPRFDLPQGIAEALMSELVQAAHFEANQQADRIEAPLALARWRPGDEAASWLRNLRRFEWEIDYESGSGSSEATDEEGKKLYREHQDRLGRLHGWARQLQHLILVLEGVDIDSAAHAWRHHLQQPKANRNLARMHLQEPTEIELLRSLLFVTETELCVDLILERPANEGAATGCLRTLPLGMTAEQVQRCWKTLLDRSNEEVVEKLQLLALDIHGPDPAALDRLIEIAEKNERWATEVAAFALISANATLIRRLIDSGVGLRLEAVVNAYETGYPGLGAKLPVDDLLNAAPANFASFFMAQREDRDFGPFADAVRMFPQREGPGWHHDCGRRGFPNRYRFDEAALSKALSLHPDVLDDLLGMLDTCNQGAESPLQRSHHLYMAVCDHLLPRDLERALRLLDALLRIEWYEESMLGSKTSKPSDLCWRLMVRHVDKPEISVRLERNLDALTDDTSLEAFAQLFEAPQDQWLWRRIETDARSDRQLLVARAMTLASYAHDGERALELLRTLENQVEGWLARVHQAALVITRNGVWSRHWFDQFLRRPKPEESWAAFRLFINCVDRRYHSWLPEALTAASHRYRDRSRKMVHLRGSSFVIDTVIRERSKKLTKDKFCHTEMASGIFPWMSMWTYPARFDRQMVSGRLE